MENYKNVNSLDCMIFIRNEKSLLNIMLDKICMFYKHPFTNGQCLHVLMENNKSVNSLDCMIFISNEESVLNIMLEQLIAYRIFNTHNS